MKRHYPYILLAMAAIFLTLTACTNSKAIIAEKEQEISQLRLALNNCNSELGTTKRECNQQLALIEAEEQELIQRERELKQRLASDIDAKNIEIEKLRGFLSVKVMDRVLFRSGSIIILPEGEAVLARIAASLIDSDENLSVEGHTDDIVIGSLLAERIPSNWELSVLRAAQVVRFLEANEIAATRLRAVGYSKYKPSVENNSNENRQLNRRVDIILSPNKGN